ncbi:hypothetical protein BDV19DRAFT_395857 [Aspergillus venezuelensis]
MTLIYSLTGPVRILLDVIKRLEPTLYPAASFSVSHSLIVFSKSTSAMSVPVTQARAYRRIIDGSRIEPVVDDLPKSLAPDEVLIKIHAVALNYRDVGMLKASKFSAPLAQGVPCCDCAAEVLIEVTAGSGLSQ